MCKYCKIQFLHARSLFTSFKDSDKVTLRNVAARVKQGQVLAITGPVGCGKVIVDIETSSIE